jgi:hypothetical protein
MDARASYGRYWVTGGVVIVLLLILYLLFRDSVSAWLYTRAVAYEVVESGSQSPVKENKNFVIVNLEEWQDLWQYVHPSERAPLPAIDFSRYVVLALFQGDKPSGGYSLDVTNVYDNSGSVVVEVRDVEPGQGCTVTQAKTAPFVFVVTQKFSGSLATEVSRSVVDCNG